ncbi:MULTISPECIES: clostripain-related cysteine peptidase [unclassified Microcoleus]|uniref:clostripain-related cysteine peptidase n=1 Tax=unclassified Microcoleus TaxID=2642155 RepID=UPI002FD6DDD4
MKRRKALKLITVSMSSLIETIYSGDQYMLGSTVKNHYDWILLYWMPYDNNLSRFGQPIIQMLSKGVKNDKVLVVVQSDFSGAAQVSRSIISQDKVDTQYLETADSSSAEVLAEYLTWAQSQFQAKRWAIVFLGHSGTLMEISPDEHPTSPSISEIRWMNLEKINQVIFNFNQSVKGNLELLFFQNCNKGNIEVHHTFQKTAKYTLSSQLQLGAPNYYYEKLLSDLSDYPDIDGSQLAKKIMDYERPDMYHSLTLTNNRYFRYFSEKVNVVIDSILQADIAPVKVFISSILSPEVNFPNNNTVVVYQSSGETFVDFANFLQQLTQLSGASPSACNDLLLFLNNFLIQRVQQNGELFDSRIRHKYKNLSGLGLFLPRNRQKLEKYLYLSVYSDLKLVELFDAVVFETKKN